MKRDESNRVYWFQTRFLSLDYLYVVLSQRSSFMYSVLDLVRILQIRSKMFHLVWILRAWRRFWDVQDMWHPFTLKYLIMTRDSHWISVTVVSQQHCSQELQQSLSLVGRMTESKERERETYEGIIGIVGVWTKGSRISTLWILNYMQFFFVVELVPNRVTLKAGVWVFKEITKASHEQCICTMYYHKRGRLSIIISSIL